MPKKVLIVEDNADIGRAQKMLIEIEGFEVVLADRASTGLDLALAMDPDLIIVDIRLPDGNGLEITRQLRAAPETANTPILAVSSYIQGLHDEVLAAGCNEACSKTTFIDNYRETLQKYLAEPNDRLARE